MRSSAIVLAAAVVLVGSAGESVAGQQPAGTPAGRTVVPPASGAGRPLERLAPEVVLVLPARYLVFADSLGWSERAGSVPEWLAALDDEIRYAFSERGLGRTWKFADDIERSALVNSGLVPDPRLVDAAQLRPGRRLDAWQLRDPLASQLRALVALSDARYVLYPVEVRVTGGAGSGGNQAGAGRATLHAVVLDARRSQVVWAGDIAGASARALAPGVAADLAARLAELVAPLAR